jgi:hypothetical protein
MTVYHMSYCVFIICPKASLFINLFLPFIVQVSIFHDFNFKIVHYFVYNFLQFSVLAVWAFIFSDYVAPIIKGIWHT